MKKDESKSCSEQSYESNDIKAAYERRMESRLAEIGSKIDTWLEKTSTFKSQLVQGADDLKKKQEAALARLQALRQKSGAAWEEFRNGMDGAWKELQLAYDELKTGSEKAMSKLEEKEYNGIS